MDVEYAHAIAPAASILVIEAAPARSQTKELQNQRNAVNVARNSKGVVAISMSWGYGEMSNVASYDKYFTTPSGHAGITFIASSGDFGYVEYPAASPNVLSVGGTSLYLNSSGATSPRPHGSIAAAATAPTSRSRTIRDPLQTTGQRATPDVAFDANPSTGVAIYETSPHSATGSRKFTLGQASGSSLGGNHRHRRPGPLLLAGKGSLGRTHPDLAGSVRASRKRLPQRSPVLPFGGLSSLFGFLFDPAPTVLTRTSRRASGRRTANRWSQAGSPAAQRPGRRAGVARPEAPRQARSSRRIRQAAPQSIIPIFRHNTRPTEQKHVPRAAGRHGCSPEALVFENLALTYGV